MNDRGFVRRFGPKSKLEEVEIVFCGSLDPWGWTVKFLDTGKCWCVNVDNIYNVSGQSIKKSFSKPSELKEFEMEINKKRFLGFDKIWKESGYIKL